MGKNGPVTIGESMAMAALMTGRQPEQVTAFVVLVADANGDGAVVHNCQSYLALITFLIDHARSVIDEMQVDQVIEFHEAVADGDRNSGKNLPCLAMAAPL